MSSILTNDSTMVALQTLKNINSQLGKTQSDIATGKTVANAKDNAAVWTISKVMDTDQWGFQTIQSNLNVADAVASTARTGAEKVVSDLTDTKNPAIAATNTATASEKLKNSNDIELKFKQIASVIGGTQMNGVNLLKTDEPDLRALASLDRGAGVTTEANTILVESATLDTALGLDDQATGISTMFAAATSLDPADDPAGPDTGAADAAVDYLVYAQDRDSN